MTPSYDVLVQGNSVRLRDGFLGISTIALIHTAAGPILFDTGGYVTRITLLKALQSRGLAPADLQLVFLSHLHFDHAHNVDLFPHAKFLVSRAEWDYVDAPHPDDLMLPWGIKHQLERGRFELIEGEGRLAPGVSFSPAPGHTPGCYAIDLQTSDKGLVVIAGDAIKYAKEAVLRQCDMTFDTPETGNATITAILDRADRIVPGHFPELIRMPHGGFVWEENASLDLVIR
jgi:glyoxylase-like metal-dependent hydrolase (beta-lactamase superfamily II)